MAQGDTVMRRLVWMSMVVAGFAAACGGGALDVEIAVGVTDQQVYPFVFIASGPAVDKGVICPAGEVEEGPGASNIARNTFVCEDGTGSFGIETVVDLRGFEGEGVPVSDWTVTSGTEEYATLRGTGSHSWFAPDEVAPRGNLNAVCQLIEGTVESG